MKRLAFTLVVAVLTAAGVVETWRVPPPVRPEPAVQAMELSMPMGHPHGVHAADDGPLLPPGAMHGLAHRLREYPALYLATSRQRTAAERLRARLDAATRRYAIPAAAGRAGFDLRRAHRAHGERRVMWFHSENRRLHALRDGSLQPDRPDTLIYADLPGRPLRLVGVMISMPRGLRGPTPGGPITRWHHHLVCVSGAKRGLAPRADGSCPAGASRVTGSEMMHVWFTRDLRSAYAIHAPWPELCAARLLPGDTCASGERFNGM